MQVKFGEQRWEPRLEKALDSGLLYHSVGEPGLDYWLSWIRAFEFQVMQSGTSEGNTGDFWSMDEGKLQLQSEAGEVFYKGIEIRLLEQMPEEYVSRFE